MKLLKNKKVLIGVSSIVVIAIFAITLSLTLAKGNNNKVYQVKAEEKKENQVGGFLTLMLETEAGSGQYQESTSSLWPGDGYVFNSELSSCQNGSELSWNEELGAVTLSTSIADSCYVYFDVYNPPTFADNCRDSDSNTLACHVATTYTTDGENGLYYHDADLANGAEDNGYRYSGANPNNYVCFGSIETPCPAENLYRIIGVLNDNGEYQVKLIKSDYTTSAMLGTDGRDYYGSYVDSMGESSYYKGNMTQSDIAAYRWNSDTSVDSLGSNNWTTSEFNTINLNTNYWNYLGSTWQNLIATTTWHLGGMDYPRHTAKAFYDGERSNAVYGSNPTTYTDEIGLMYPSDYGYAAYPDAWATNLSSYENSSITSNNWMYMGLFEWIITPSPPNRYSVFCLYNSGRLTTYSPNRVYSVRPVFYLNSNVEYNGGTGTESDPFSLVPLPIPVPPPIPGDGPSTGDVDWDNGL